MKAASTSVAVNAMHRYLEFVLGGRGSWAYEEVLLFAWRGACEPAPTAQPR